MSAPGSPQSGGWTTGKAVAVCAAATVATLLPYLALWLRSPPGYCYLGLKAVNSDDHLTYVAWMEQALRGSGPWMQNLFTVESRGGDYFIPFFWIIGAVGRLLGASAMAAFHGSRLVAAFLLFLSCWWFVGTFFGGWSRVRAFLLLAFGTGLPGFVPEASPISAAYDATLMAASWALVLVAFGTFRRGLLDGSVRDLLTAGVAGAVLAVIHPYDVVPLVAVMTISALLPVAKASFPARFGRLAISGAVITLGVAFTAWLVLSSPLLRAWAEHPRPMFWWALLSFGALWIGAAAAVWRREAEPFLLIWLTAGLVLCFIPSPIARRLVQGLQAPLAVLATIGFEGWIARGWGRFARLTEVTIYPAAVMTLLLDPSFILFDKLPPYYVECDLLADVRELETLPPGLLFTPPGLGYLVPPLTARQVWAGNYGLTLNFADKRLDYTRLADGKLDGDDLARMGARYVVTLGGGLEGRPGIRHLRTLRKIQVWEVGGASPDP